MTFAITGTFKSLRVPNKPEKGLRDMVLSLEIDDAHRSAHGWVNFYKVRIVKELIDSSLEREDRGRARRGAIRSQLVPQLSLIAGPRFERALRRKVYVARWACDYEFVSLRQRALSAGLAVFDIGRAVVVEMASTDLVVMCAFDVVVDNRSRHHYG